MIASVICMKDATKKYVCHNDVPYLSAKTMERLEEEIQHLHDTVDGLENYQIVDKLGEGTFSTVYKAIDVHHDMYSNAPWFKSNTVKIMPRVSKSTTVYVALKRIYVTSSTARILNELEIMESLRGQPYISYLITAFRSADQVIAVMPYSRHTEFRVRIALTYLRTTTGLCPFRTCPITFTACFLR